MQILKRYDENTNRTATFRFFFDFSDLIVSFFFALSFRWGEVFQSIILC